MFTQKRITFVKSEEKFYFEQKILFSQQKLSWQRKFQMWTVQQIIFNKGKLKSSCQNFSFS